MFLLKWIEVIYFDLCLEVIVIVKFNEVGFIWSKKIRFSFFGRFFGIIYY